ncbi:Hypothetical predicted protein [Pelobates cultripes]|uniref:Reverse transcriptase zinc-binding domain-containing protein n=1 Tax=Pelobates cultripes TaxID=61616 RepID=A0AAD1SAB0_PELCU|nr:Hypothetical predicted protein [Pelobates cultripes]
MSLPNVKLYHKAAVLASLLPIHQNKPPPQWVSIEQQWLQSQDIQTTLWTLPHLRANITKALPATLTTLKIWDDTRKLLCSCHPTPLSTPIKTLIHTIPDFNFRIWNRCGVFYIYSLLEKGELASFDYLKTAYTLPNTAYYSYLQLRSWWKTQIPHPIPQITTILTHFEKSIIADTPAVKPISTIYKLLLPQQGIKSLTCVRSWEKDLNQTLPEQTWLAAANATRGLTFCASHLETTRKNFYRWYMVPTRLATMDPQLSSTCWHCKQEAGTFLHIWWKCIKLQPYWKEVISLIHQHTSITIPNSPKALLLLMWDTEYPKPIKYLLLHILVAAQNLIAKNWLSPTNATMRELIRHLSQIGKFESNISRIPPNKSWRHEVWENWELKHPT